MHIIVVGSGAAGLAAAWLLSRAHKVTLLEKAGRLGGHAHTATIDNSDGTATTPDSGIGSLKIDTGFIVFNELSYPNFSRWLDELEVQAEDSDMSFAVSRDGGNFEYAGGPALGMLAQPGLLLRPRYWSMLKELLRFYRNAPRHVPADATQTLGDYLKQHNYSQAFIDDHLLPFGAAIWSTPRQQMLAYPAAAFIRFCANHGLLQITNRPQWRTVSGGSEQYVNAVGNSLNGDSSVITDFDVQRITRGSTGVSVTDRHGQTIKGDQVVIAAHADQALQLLDEPSAAESTLLEPFRYESNLAILHDDTSYLPRRRRAWCSWNYVERRDDDSSRVSLSYWMNRLQNLHSRTNYIVTLNPTVLPDAARTYRSETYRHPVFTSRTWTAQQDLWTLQGQNRTWFCGSYFGSGFHEDAVQSGLAVAEQLGGIERPWVLDNPSTRIVVPSTRLAGFSASAEAAA